MQLAKLLDPGLQGKGAIVLDVHSTGNTASELGAQGQIRLQDVTLTSESLPNGLQHLNGTLDLTPTSVRVVQLTGESGGGQLTAGGTVTYRPQVDLNLNVNARDVRLRYPQGLRALLSGDLSLSGNTQAALINGRVLINSIGFTEDFDLASFAGQFGEGQATAPPEGVTQNIKLDVAVQSSNDLTAANPEISLQGQANLRVVGTVAEPVILGRTDLTGGDLFFRNQRYTLQRGIITFANPNETQPVLNVEIGTVVQQYNLTLSFIGPIDRLRTTYTSDPPLPPVDVINLLVRGQTTEEASPGNLDANSVLAEGLAGQVSSRVQKFAGLSSLQIDPTLGGNGTDPGARIAIQQRVTRNFIFTFSHDVTNPQADIVQGEYQISRRWSVQASRDQYGSVNVGGKFTKTF
jgi:translocation and assembly module TamB